MYKGDKADLQDPFARIPIFQKRLCDRFVAQLTWLQLGLVGADNDDVFQIEQRRFDFVDLRLQCRIRDEDFSLHCLTGGLSVHQDRMPKTAVLR